MIKKTGKYTKHSSVEIIAPFNQIPENTVKFTQNLIQTRFLKNPVRWGDRYGNVNNSNFNDKVEASLYFCPLNGYGGKKFNEIWYYRLSIRTLCIRKFLISQDGHIIYGNKERNNSWDVGYCERKPDGIYIDIINEYSNGLHSTGIVTEFLLKKGLNKLEMIKRIDKRVNINHYLNNWFDGKFWNGKYK